MTARRALLALLLVMTACSPAHREFAVRSRADVTAVEAVRGGFVLVTVGGRVRTSPDGRRWTDRRQARAAFVGARINDIESTHLGVVAVGQRNGSAAAFWSPDSIVWAAMDAPALAATRDSVLDRVADTPDALVATGRVEGRLAAWVTTDGHDWTRIAPPALDQVTSLCSTPDLVLAVGPAGGVPGAAVLGPDRTWSRPYPFGVSRDVPAGCAVGPNGYLVAGASPAGALVWSSADGVSWSPGRPVSGTAAVSIARSPARLVLAGYDRHGALALTSIDGHTWRGHRVAGSGSDSELVAATDLSIVVTGHAGKKPAIWST